MKKQKLNNKGFTLIETTVCFILLSILLVAAAQVITSSTEVYYYSKSISYGVQAAQVIATEIRGDLEDAVIKQLYIGDGTLPTEAIGKCVYISDDKKSICFINGEGEQVMYSLKPDPYSKTSEKVLYRDAVQVYDEYFDEIEYGEYKDIIIYTPQYVGMDYKVKDISFTVFDKSANIPTNYNGNEIAGVGDFPVIVMELTVSNPQYGDYNCTEYIPLYNFYGTAAASLVNDN